MGLETRVETVVRMGVRSRKFRAPEQLLLPWSPQQTISVRHAAEILDVSVHTIFRLIEDGSLKAYQIRENRKHSPWRIFYDSLLAYVERIHERHGLEKRF